MWKTRCFSTRWSNMKEKNFITSKEGTLLEILKGQLKDLSNKKIKSFVKYKMVEVNGHVVTNVNTLVLKGSNIKVYFSKKVIDEYDLDIIYEDSDIIVIDKPAGLLSISNSKEKETTAFRLVSDYVKKDKKNAKIFVVHRLDQGTSGVLMFAKNLSSKKIFQDNWNDIVLKREYIAVVEGKMPSQGTIENYLTMNHFQIVHSTKNRESGWLAITHYRLLKYKNSYSLLEVNIDTGRRNQIRVHMSESGHPVTGDKKYGAKKNPINRLALHASKLHIEDPRSGKILKFESHIPKEIQQLTD